MMRFPPKLLLILFIALNCFIVNAQSQYGYCWPIDSPRVITGNYGELRPNHFHSGLDFSTNGKVNLPVYSIFDGYISRIKISSAGYGKAIYITFKDGRVGLYGHLNSLNKTLAQFVKKEQYARQSYDIDVFPKPYELPVKNHGLIGLSGNTGNSTGPHLHFEIRDGKTEMPLNPLEYYEINDVTPPTIQQVAFYSLGDTCSPKFIKGFKLKRNKKDSLFLENDSIILKEGILGFAFSGYDQYEPKGNQNNIFCARLYLDERLIYTHELDSIHFNEQRFVNEFSETVEKFKYQKCFLPTLYPNGLYANCKRKGRILITDTNYHSIRLNVNDESGNERVIQFAFKTRKLNYYSPPSINSDIFVNCEEDFMISKNKLQIFIPAGTLYYSTGLIFENTIESTGKLMVLPAEVNLKSTSIVGFEVPAKYLRNKTKLILKSGSSVLPPISKGDSVFFSVKNFGSFLLDQDTVSPKIKTQLNAQLKNSKKPDSFSFIINDDLSGIRKYNVFIDNKWVLGEYDAKADLVTYYFDENTPAGPLNFKVEAEDMVGNKSVLEYTLKR
jgi:hypothetical protein